MERASTPRGKVVWRNGRFRFLRTWHILVGMDGQLPFRTLDRPHTGIYLVWGKRQLGIQFIHRKLNIFSCMSTRLSDHTPAELHG